LNITITKNIYSILVLATFEYLGLKQARFAGTVRIRCIFIISGSSTLFASSRCRVANTIRRGDKGL